MEKVLQRIGRWRFLAQEETETPDVAIMEKQVLDLINKERTKRGLKPLKSNEALAKAAQKHTKRMAQDNFFSHTDKQGKSVADRVNAERYRWSRVGENIALNSGFSDPVVQAVEGWMQSRGHRENILNADFTETGIGVVARGKTLYYTQVFARPQRR
jgi:uncharacterized protein YkwD